MRGWPYTRLATIVGTTVAIPLLAGGVWAVDATTPDSTEVAVGTLPTLAPASTEPPIAAPSLADAPPVDAAAFEIFDATAGCVLASQDADVTRPVGSLMKLLTAHVVIDAGEPERTVTVPDLQLDADESAIGLHPGERLRRDVLLRAMLIVSANDAAVALAVDVAGSQEAFVERMNDTARALGLDQTIAANPSGLDAPGAGSSAHDLIELADRLMGHASFRATVARDEAYLHGEVHPATNELVGAYPGATGIKTGTTTGGGASVVGAATRDGRSLIVALLGATSSDNRFEGAAALLDWGFAASCP
jgi:D-alanyl-D-alanine carboxypeptidase (penicillin-binding protein 5/6)